jgi:uncharacterized protein (UPF0218 family)
LIRRIRLAQELKITLPGEYALRVRYVNIKKREKNQNLKHPWRSFLLHKRFEKNWKIRFNLIGDVTTLNLQKEGIIPDIGIIENRIERKDYLNQDKIYSLKIQLNAENPPGTITPDLCNAIKKHSR